MHFQSFNIPFLILLFLGSFSLNNASAQPTNEPIVRTQGKKITVEQFVELTFNDGKKTVIRMHAEMPKKGIKGKVENELEFVKLYRKVTEILFQKVLAEVGLGMAEIVINVLPSYENETDLAWLIRFKKKKLIINSHNKNDVSTTKFDWEEIIK